MLPIKKAMRLSRFSQNINPELIKNLASFLSRQGLDQKDKNNTNQSIDSLVPTKRSIIIDERRNSRDLKIVDQNIKQNKDEDLFCKENITKKIKYYQIQEINKYRQSLLELPNLIQKNKKTKFKYITPQFIEFFFQILRSFDIIQKLFSSYVPHEAVVNQFFNILNGFQIKKENSGKCLEFSKQDDYFWIFIEGAAQKIAVKQASKLDRKSSLTECSSQTSIIRRSKIKNKTVTEKGRIACFQNNIPILVNQKDLAACTLQTKGVCTFLLLDKGVWAKFLIALQKLEQKHLVGFIKHSTTINLNVYTDKQKTSQNEKTYRQKFLYDLKFPKNNQSDNESDSEENYKQSNQRKNTIHVNSLSSSYKLFNLPKEEIIKVNNQDIYLIVKGSIYLTTDFYSMLINEGSIINSSILLDLSFKQVQIKALIDCLIVRLVLDEIYFQKQDENDFIFKIKQIEEFRNKINRKCNKENFNTGKVQKTIRKTFIENQFLQKDSTIIKQQGVDEQKNKNSKFQPKQLRLKQLSFLKGNQKNKLSPKKPRISHSNNFQAQPDSHQTQLARKVAVKYANNYCIFQKIVQSQQKVIEKYNLNRVNKLFPIQALLRNLNFTKALQQGRTNSKKHTYKKVNFSKNQDSSVHAQNIDQKNEIQRMQYEYLQKQRLSRKSSKSRTKSKKSNISKNDLKSLKKRRQKYAKNLMQKKKKQRSKIIDNLFEINPTAQKNNQQKNLIQRQNISLDFHKQRIKQIVNRNSQMKLNQLNSQRKYIDFRGSYNDQYIDQIQQNQLNNRNGKHKNISQKSKYSDRFLVTQPNYSQIKCLQKVISGQNLSTSPSWINSYYPDFNKTNRTQITHNFSHLNNSSSDNFLSDQFVKLKKMTTKRIKTTMLTGRIRQSKAK